jgi:hypothetical protein
MTDNVNNLTLEILQALRSEVQTLRMEIHDEFKDVKQRLLTIEHVVDGMKRDKAELFVTNPPTHP